MRPNRLRELLGTGRPLFGTFITFPDPNLVEFSGLAGFDYVHFDGEHEGHGVETCYSLVRAADAVGVASIVRVPVNRPEIVLAYAETGVDGIVAPHIEDRGGAEGLVAALRYPPKGVRGAGSTSRAANYGLTQPAVEYFTASQHAVPIPLVEDVSGFEKISEIAATDGIALINLGLGDLASSLGLPGQPNHPRVTTLVKEAIAAIRQVGTRVMMGGATVAGAKDALGLGADVIITTNGSLLRGAIAAYLEGVRAAL